MSNLDIVLRYMDLISEGDFEGALALTSEDAHFQSPLGEAMDKAALRAMFAAVKPMLVNRLEQEIVGTTCEGSRVAIESRASTVLANGNTYSNLYHFLFKVENGLITACHEYNNPLAASAFGPLPG